MIVPRQPLAANRVRPYVLVGDGDAPLKAALVSAMEEEGLAVREAADGDGCAALVRSQEPAAIIVAEDMLSTKGVELLPVLRCASRSPIIVVGDGGEEAVVKALLKGADMYMGRPLNYSELVSRIRTLTRWAGRVC